jgi:hypothetical protein
MNPPPRRPAAPGAATVTAPVTAPSPTPKRHATVSFGRMLILAQRRFARGASTAGFSPADAAAR